MKREEEEKIVQAADRRVAYQLITAKRKAPRKMMQTCTTRIDARCGRESLMLMV
jgi:hypothetical protein